MSFLFKDQWQDWAREWGLTHVPEKGWLRRTERVLGPRNGLLFVVLWDSDRNPSLHVWVRYPVTDQLESLRDALSADPSLDALPGKGVTRRNTVISDGEGRLHFGPMQFLITDESLLWRHAFSFKAPKAAEIQAWVDTLTAAVARATPVFDGACEGCATGRAPQYVIVGDMPEMLCPTCQQNLRDEGGKVTRAA